MGASVQVSLLCRQSFCYYAVCCCLRSTWLENTRRRCSALTLMRLRLLRPTGLTQLSGAHSFCCTQRYQRDLLSSSCCVARVRLMRKSRTWKINPRATRSPFSNQVAPHSSSTLLTRVLLRPYNRI